MAKNSFFDLHLITWLRSLVLSCPSEGKSHVQVPKRKDFDLAEFQVETGFGEEMERCRSNVNLTERSDDVFVVFFSHEISTCFQPVDVYIR